MIRADADTSALAALYTGLSAVASGELAARANREAAEGLQALVAQEFAEGRGPDGEAWPAPKDGGRPGYRSGALASAASVDAYGSRLLLRAPGVAYARFFTRGTRKMAARPVFPAGKLPPAWKRVIQLAHRRAVERRLRRAR